MLIQNGIALLGDRLCESAMRLEGEVIAEVAPAIAEHPGEPVIDAIDCYVLPGLIDLHTHVLQDAMPQRGDWLRYARMQLEQGVTACVPTLFAAPEELIYSMRCGLEETDRFRRTPSLIDHPGWGARPSSAGGEDAPLQRIGTCRIRHRQRAGRRQPTWRL
ncbi:MAG: hypothetical protein NZ765_12485 [Anaerolineae bacterium]|nr:hypothetical protein [Anaerolineae bacterium]